MGEELDTGVACAECGRGLAIQRTDPAFAKLRAQMVRLDNGKRALLFILPKSICSDCGSREVHVTLVR